jgi:hypothetical protein
MTGAMQLMKLARLRCAISYGAVLRLSTRTRDDVLVLQGPGDDIVIEKYRVARNGLACWDNPLN